MSKHFGIGGRIIGKIGKENYYYDKHGNIVQSKPKYVPVNSSWIKKKEFEEYVKALANSYDAVNVVDELPEEFTENTIYFLKINENDEYQTYVYENEQLKQINFVSAPIPEQVDAVDVLNELPQTYRNNTIYYIKQDSPTNDTLYQTYVYENNTLKKVDLSENRDDIVYLNESQVLTNKTINADNNTITNLESDNLKSGVLVDNLTTNDSTKLLSAKQGKVLNDNKVDKTTTVNGHALSGNITVTKNDIGLGNVNNTSDINKPVSTATQNALNNKVDQMLNASINKTRNDLRMLVNGHTFYSSVNFTASESPDGSASSSFAVLVNSRTVSQSAMLSVKNVLRAFKYDSNDTYCCSLNGTIWTAWTKMSTGGDVDNKVDKTTQAYKIYGTTVSGGAQLYSVDRTELTPTHTNIPTSALVDTLLKDKLTREKTLTDRVYGVSASAGVDTTYKFNKTSAIGTETSTIPSEKVVSNALGNKVDKTTEVHKIYGTSSTGTQYKYGLEISTLSDSSTAIPSSKLVYGLKPTITDITITILDEMKFGFLANKSIKIDYSTHTEYHYYFKLNATNAITGSTTKYINMGSVIQANIPAPIGHIPFFVSCNIGTCPAVACAFIGSDLTNMRLYIPNGLTMNSQVSFLCNLTFKN